MLRDIPRFGREAHDDVFMNGAPTIEIEHANQADALDDVFGSAPPSPTLNGGDDGHVQEHAGRAPALDPSDIPRLRSLHVTNGYREGIAVSKEKHMQDGFDEGYTLGAELGLRAGWCLGALEGIWHALQANRTSPASEASSDAVNQHGEEVRQMLAIAEAELKLQNLFGRVFFGEDGIWLYEVPGHGDEDQATFEQVAEAHPVVKKWDGAVSDLSAKLGLDLR